MLDVFKQDAFSVLGLTDAFNNIPFVPGRLGQLGIFAETGVTNTKISIEERNGILSLIPPSARGGPGSTTDKVKRNLRALAVPHFEVDDAVMADEVQGVRAFGTEDSVQTVQGVVDARMGEHAPYFDATLENQRIGAWKGIVTYADGSTLNLFTEFGVTQEAEIDFDLDNATPASGAVAKKCNQVTRLIATNLGGLPYTGIMGFCGDNFWDDLIAHEEVRDTFKYQQGDQLRAMKPYSQLSYGGIVFENYKGAVDGTAFVDTDKCHFAPLGTPNFFRTVFAPADYIETVNTMGLPRYAKQIPMDNDKGVRIEMQSNPLSYCRLPKALIKAKRT